MMHLWCGFNPGQPLFGEAQLDELQRVINQVLPQWASELRAAKHEDSKDRATVSSGNRLYDCIHRVAPPKRGLGNAVLTGVYKVGFTSLRQAIDSNDLEWAGAEIELLHNVPSLLDESNIERHRYFWFTERDHYIQWASQLGRDAPRSRMLVFYEPVWHEMEPILLERFGESS